MSVLIVYSAPWPVYRQQVTQSCSPVCSLASDARSCIPQLAPASCSNTPPPHTRSQAQDRGGLGQAEDKREVLFIIYSLVASIKYLKRSLNILFLVCCLWINIYTIHIDFLDIIINLVNENQLVQVLSLVSD